jgi:hypothetical protein
MTRRGVACAQTRTWDDDTDGICSAATALELSGRWRQVHMSEPSDYMPLNPLPEEAAKKIRYIAYEVQ